MELNLNEIRNKLIRMEDSIIFGLFERVQYKTNDIIYIPGGISIPGFEGSFFDYLLYGTEKLHSSAGRYLHAEEHPFSKDLLEPAFSRPIEESYTKQVKINVNDKIKYMYLEAIQNICEKGDDKHYGSAAVCDINCVQTLSKRIHYGTFVAEAKFQEDPECYKKLIESKDIDGIVQKLTNKEVEKAIFERVKQKGERYNINPQFISEFYERKVIPLTTKVEVEYLMKRK